MKRLAMLSGFLAIAMVAALAAPSQPTEAQAGCYPQTGFCITNPAFQQYYDQRGQQNTLGYPISRSFTLEGFEVQFFQRVVLQLQGGNVQRLNILDPGILPLTRANQSVFPASNPSLASAAPQVGSADYASRIVEFVRSVAPETYQGLPVRFFSTFNNAVPSSPGTNPDIQTLLNLEIWGVPTSEPAFDPGNQGFVYQRFQRGIMHFRAECQCTEGILVGEYLKSVITGQNLPPDLAADTQGSRFTGQYAPGAPGWVARPAQLQATDMTNAFEPGTGSANVPPRPPQPQPPSGPTATPVGPTATAVPGDALPTVRFNIDDSNRRINFGQTIRVEIIAEDDRGLDRVEFEGEVGENNNENSNDNVSASDEAFQRRIFEDECEGRTFCAIVFEISPRTSGNFILVARARDNARQTTEATIEVRVRDDRSTATPTTAAATATPTATTAAAAATATPTGTRTP